MSRVTAVCPASTTSSPRMTAPTPLTACTTWPAAYTSGVTSMRATSVYPAIPINYFPLS